MCPPVPETLLEKSKTTGSEIEGLNLATPFSAETTQSRNLRSAKQYKALTKLLEIAAREIEDEGRGYCHVWTAPFMQGLI